MEPCQQAFIQTDASDRGLGGMLSQVVEEEEHPMLYISRKLSRTSVWPSSGQSSPSDTICSDHTPLQWLHRHEGCQHADDLMVSGTSAV
ncbi:hypothetical protein PGIGA_G00172360 [Pangasianodon gigas]|uniref:Uncharacterized protein n=1 Tax=Pangasianodon gigas TaxID=30993 RepID=A0ACC5XU55_PANGG|nr:hypothetical protein [Pangasianodon gigas]